MRSVEVGATLSAPTFTKGELRRIAANLLRLLPPGARPLNAEELVTLNADIKKTRLLIAAAESTPERGRLVLSWRVPREQALTLNQYAQAKGWQKKKLRNALDDALRALLPSFPEALTNGSLLKRWLRVTRFSTQRVDELSVDLLGGKMCVDSLKRCGVIADDDEKHVHREPCWAKTKRGTTHVLVEVFLLAAEQVATPEPANATVQQILRTPGLLTQMLIDGLPKKGTTY